MVYHLSAPESWLRLQVYRGGRLARLGHNHVISSSDIRGLLRLSPNPANSRADLYLPVASLEVDNAELRAAAGADFQTEPSAADIQGTRDNLLGESLLDAAHYPFIQVRVRSLSGDATAPTAEVQFLVRDRTSTRQLPLQIEAAHCSLEATASFSLRQTELGLTPFSVLGGALRVEDTIDVTLQLLGRSRSPACAGTAQR